MGRSNIKEIDVVALVSRPDLWLTLGVGLSAIIFLWVFARATGTIRVGLAVAISMVFLGILLFPTTFTVRIPKDMRDELVSAWQWVVIFYFGSEAAVQAFKVMKPEGAAVDGDIPKLSSPAKQAGVGR